VVQSQTGVENEIYKLEHELNHMYPAEAVQNITLSPNAKKIAFDSLNNSTLSISRRLGANFLYRSVYVSDIFGQSVEIDYDKLGIKLPKQKRDEILYLVEKKDLTDSAHLHSPRWIGESTLEIKGSLYYGTWINVGDKISYVLGPECLIQVELYKNNIVHESKIVKKL